MSETKYVCKTKICPFYERFVEPNNAHLRDTPEGKQVVVCDTCGRDATPVFVGEESDRERRAREDNQRNIEGVVDWLYFILKESTIVIDTALPDIEREYNNLTVTFKDGERRVITIT